MNASAKFAAFAFLATIALPSANAKGNPPEQYVSGGDSRMQQGRYLDAAQEYSHAIKGDKRNPNYYQLRGRAELAGSKFKAAADDAAKSIKFAPDDANGYEIRAKSFDSLKQYKKERDDLNKLISLRPGVGTYLLQRAQTSVELHQMEQVIQDCDQAIKLGLDRTQLAELYKMRSIAYKKLGKKTEAQQEASKYQSLR
jgi:tetratricopeptide (TPR) repeat protein